MARNKRTNTAVRKTKEIILGLLSHFFAFFDFLNLFLFKFLLTLFFLFFYFLENLICFICFFLNLSSFCSSIKAVYQNRLSVKKLSVDYWCDTEISGLLNVTYRRGTYLTSQYFSRLHFFLLTVFFLRICNFTFSSSCFFFFFC